MQQKCQRIKERKQLLGITIENLARLSGVGVRTVNRLFKGEDVKLSTVEAVTTLLGLDLAGNETVSIGQVRKKRAKEKARYLASLVQSTSALEMQGLDDENIETIVNLYEKEFLHGNYRKTLWVA